MDKIQDFISKVSAAWVSIGLLITALGISNVGNINLSELFSAESLEGLTAVAGAIITYIGYLKSKVIIATDAGVKAFSAGSKSSLAFNPFKFSI